MRAASPQRLAALLVLSAAASATAAPPGTAGAADASSPDVYERGEQVMQRFCLSCHGASGGHARDPLGPRLRPEVWGDPEQAYANVGQLWRVNRRMDQPFPGDDAERRALAAWLSRRARENQASAWKRLLPWAGALASAAVAAGLLVRARRRDASRPPPG